VQRLEAAAVRTPQKIPGLADVTQLAAGNEMNAALRSDGTLLVWGIEDYGLRGDGVQRDGDDLPVPTPVTPLSRVTRIATAGSTILVLAPVATMPNVVGELRATALGQLQALGLTVQVQTVPDPDRRCDHVGYVESQSPSPGTVVGPGVYVRIRVYGPAQGGCF